MQLSVSAPTAREVKLAAAFGEGAGPAAAATTISLQAGAAQTVTLAPVAVKSGDNALVLSVQDGQLRSSGSYQVTVPAPATFRLDEYAYPSTQLQGQWMASLNCAPELLPQMKLGVTLAALDSGKTIWQRSLPAAETVELLLEIADLPVGRYEASAQLEWNGKVAQSDRREFIVFQPATFPAWEPVQTTRAVGDTIFLNGKPFLGRMLFHAPIEAGKRAQGYNLVHASAGDPDPLPEIQQCLDACQKAGLYACVALFNNQYLNKGSEFNLANVERVVNAVKNHPALWGYDLIDEPEFSMKPEAVQAGAGLVRKLDPNHLVWVNLCQTDRMTDYLGSQDLWSFDFYPFPTLTPFSFKTDWLRLTDEKLLGKKPLGTCLQTFTYNRHQQRMTSPDELRTSAWLHIIHGYKWLGYYSYWDAEPAGCLSRSPELWSYTRALNTELVQLEDVILAPGQWQPVKMQPQTDKLEAREKKLGDKWYVVVVSDSREPLRVKLIPTLTRGTRRRLIESAAPAVTGTEIETTLRPCATQVWELTP